MTDSEKNMNDNSEDIEIVDVSEDNAAEEAADENISAASCSESNDDIEILKGEDVTVDKDNRMLEPDKRKFRFTKNDIVRYVILSVSLIVFVISAVHLISTLKRYRDERRLNNDIYNKVVETDESATSADDNRNINPVLSIDFEELKSINENTVGWIDIPSLGITYPVVQHTDNDYYLSHDITNSVSWSGAIYLGYEHSRNFTDDRTMIYGHRMDDGSMFAGLLKYDSESFFREQAEKDNNYVYIYMENKINVYEIFSVTDVYYATQPEAFKFHFSSDFTEQDFLNYLKSIELYDTGITVNADDIILSLYTCQGSASSKERHMVHCRLVKSF